MIETAISPLFVPGDKPALLAKAYASAADAVIIDLEDAVAPDNKETARSCLRGNLPGPVSVRVNAVSTQWHEADIAALSNSNIEAVLLPKAESADEISRLRNAQPRAVSIVALVETVVGIENVNSIASEADRLAFGSLDYAANLGAAPEQDVLLYARTRIVMASRLAGKPAPLDGVTADFREADVCRSDTAHAVKMGFGGRLCIHPSQLEIVQNGFAPNDIELAWAEQILALGDNAAVLDGQMVDAPVKARARQIIARSQISRRPDQ